MIYDCLRFHGGIGYVRETAIERMARDARVQSIGGAAIKRGIDRCPASVSA